MIIRQSETYRTPSGNCYLVGLMLAPMWKSRHPVPFVAVDVKNTRTIVDEAFSLSKRAKTREDEKSLELPQFQEEPRIC